MLVVLLGCGGLFAVSALGVVKDGQEIMAQVDVFQEGLASGDATKVQQAAQTIQERAAHMKGEVDGPLWAVASVLPVVGTDISNARTLSAAVEDLSSNALVPLSEQAGSFDLGTLIDDGSFDVDAIEQLAGIVAQVAPVVERSAASVDAMQDGSIAKVNDITSKARTQLDGLNALCKGLDELGPYLPDMLGANGKRTYLILAHNTSEIKSSGGFIGSAGIITFEDGKMELGEFGSPAAATRADGDRISLPEEEKELFTRTYGLRPGTSGNNPEFSRESEVFVELWESKFGGDIDGTVALDSQVLQDFLGLVGAITTSDGTVVDGTNAVQVLGHDVYWKYFTKEQPTDEGGDASDAYFAEVAQLAFDKVLGNIGNVSLTGLAEVLGKNASDYRFLVWMKDAEEEHALVNLGVAGKISTDEENPQMGVFLQSRAGSKIDWWQTCDTEFSKISQNEDGSTTYAVTTTFRNKLTQEEIDQAGWYIVGTHGGQMIEDVYLYAPAGGKVSEVKASNGNEGEDFTITGTDVSRIRITVDPGSSTTLTYKITTSPKAKSELTVRSTPMAQEAN